MTLRSLPVKFQSEQDAWRQTSTVVNSLLREDGQQPFWDELDIPALSMKEPGSNAPTLAVIGSTNILSWQFPNGSDTHLHFVRRLPHTWNEASTIAPILNWLPTTTNTGSLSWRIEYIIQTIGGTFASTGTVINKVVTPGGVALDHETATFDDITTSGLRISTIMTGRITRLGSSDAFTGSAILLGMGLRIENNTSRGSQAINQKWSSK